jgi:hypothetical protein
MEIYENNSYKNRGENVMLNLRSRQIIDGAIIIFLVVGAGCVLFLPSISNIKKDNIVVEQKVEGEQKTTEIEYVEKSFQTNEIIPVQETVSVAKIETPTEESKMQVYSSSMLDESFVYESMHRGINTKIIAGDDKIWGEEEVTPKYCEELIRIIKSSDYADKETLTLFLNNWKKGNFENGVNEHNYLWGKLNGDIGKAVALRDVVN